MSVKSAILNGLMWVTLLTFPLQCIIDPSAENVASVCIVLVSSFSLLAYFKWGGAAEDQPLSTIALFGFLIMTQLGALLVQTAFWTPLRLSLYDPMMTFFKLAFYQAIALAVHVIYRYFSLTGSERPGLARALLNWAGVYRVPSSAVLWGMGCLGLMSFALSGREGVAAKLASGFNFFAWAPFLLPIYMREIGPAYCNIRRNKFLLGCYTGLVVMMGIALNVRVVMFIGVVTVTMVYFLIGIRSQAPLARKTVLQLVVVALIGLAISSPLSDLATSMAIARGARGKISPVEMVKKTIAVWSRPGLIAEYRREQSAVQRVSAYEEHYIANPLLARFVETKFHDNFFHFAKSLTTEDAKNQLRKVTSDDTWAALPTPLLRFLHVKLNKEDLNYSVGDYMAYLSRGTPLGGRKTGSMFAQGETIMGPLFPMLYAGVCLCLFALMDLLTVRRTPGHADLAALAMMNVWAFFFRGITSDAISNMFVFIFRNFMQTVLIYVVIFAIARFVLGGSRAGTKASINPGWQQAT